MRVKVAETRLKGNLDLLLLAVLKRGPGHGYDIIRRLTHDSGGRFDLPEGTVYPALHRLENEGWVRSAWDDGGPRRKRVYAINAKGARALIEQRKQWNDFTSSVTSVLGFAQ